MLAIAILLATAIGVLVITRDRERRSFRLDAVRSAFAEAGLPLSHSVVQGSDAVLGPADQSFNVMVLGPDSKAKAKEYYKPYAATPSSDTFSFQLLAGNVIIESDASNSDRPLAETSRERIRQAVSRLRR